MQESVASELETNLPADQKRLQELYTQDFYQWTQVSATQLKQRLFEQLDLENLIEEIESLGKNDRDKLVSSLKVLLIHLLKWESQPEKRSKSWEDTIFRERGNLIEYLEDAPSLAQFLTPEWVEKAYKRGLREAVRQTQLSRSKFPEKCPYTIEQLRDDNFLPD